MAKALTVITITALRLAPGYDYSWGYGPSVTFNSRNLNSPGFKELSGGPVGLTHTHTHSSQPHSSGSRHQTGKPGSLNYTVVVQWGGKTHTSVGQPHKKAEEIREKKTTRKKKI